MALQKLATDEMDQVVEMAKAMREKDKDKYKLGHALIYLVERNKLLEDLWVKADYFLRFGMGTKELTELRRAVDRLHELDAAEDDDSSLFTG